MTDYAKTKTGGIKAGRLHQEIDADAGITPVCNSVTEDSPGSDGFTVTFASALSAGEETTLDGLITAHSTVMGTRDFQMWESNGIQSTTLETYQSAFLRTAPAMAGGMYRVQWSWEMRLVAAGGVDSKAQAKFEFGGIVKGNHVTIETDWQTISSWDRAQNITEGATPTFEIQYRRKPGGDDTVEIRRLRMSFELVS